jgi:hypothetical protein
MAKRLLPLIILSACDAQIFAPAPLAEDVEVSVSGIRRLSRVELDSTVADLLGDNGQAAQQYLAPDPTNPFDNDYTQQLASAALIGALEQIATEAAARVVADPQKLAALVPCTPTGPSDSACLSAFVKSFGRRALRRALSDDEVASFATLQSFSIEGNDFMIGVKLVVQAMLQEPEFVYRIELGAPVPGRDGVYALNADQIATRLSYFLWGTMPPDWLFDAADQGALATKEGIGAAARRLLDDPRARARVERYHALWLSYYKLPHSADLVSAMQAESAALIDKVIFDDKSDYFDLFRSESTYVNPLLAEHYGLSGYNGADGGFAWTPYGSTPRRGLLSHGSVLSAGAKFADTSPTQRGIFIRTRLFCQVIPPPPPGVNVDSPPTSTASTCKADRYASHATGACPQCHQKLDPVGFGIENFDKTGAWRTHDTVPDDPNCPITGDGKLTGLPQGDATFNGVVQLEDLMMNSGQMESCISRQVFRFAFGRNDVSADSDFVARMTDGFKADNRVFTQLLLSVVTDPTFTFRKDEQ